MRMSFCLWDKTHVLRELERRGPTHNFFGLFKYFLWVWTVLNLFKRFNISEAVLPG
jgi:hypothetical protein